MLLGLIFGASCDNDRRTERAMETEETMKGTELAGDIEGITDSEYTSRRKK